MKSGLVQSGRQDLSCKFGCQVLSGQETHMPSPVKPYLSTLIWNARYCPTNNTTQANPYKSQGSGYQVDPSEYE